MNKMAKCALALLLMTVLTIASAAAEVKVGDDTYETLKEAVEAQGADTTYEIYGKVMGYLAADLTACGTTEPAI